MSGSLALALRVAVRGVRCDEVANPAKGATASDPETGGNDQPEDAAQERTVVDLTNSGNDKRKHRRKTGITWFSNRHRRSVLQNRFASI